MGKCASASVLTGGAAGKRTACSIVSAWLDFKQDGWL